MAQLRAWLQLGRMQTGAVEMAGAPLALYLGGAPWPWLLYGVLLGAVCHFVGFGVNSWLGFTSGQDDPRQAPDKAGHPLQRGAIDARTAGRVLLVLQAVGLVMFVPLGGDRWIPWAAFIGYAAFGWLYDLFASRQMTLGTVEISVSFALFFIAFGAAWTGAVSPLVAAVSVAALCWVAFQISVAGYTKDLGHGGERNLLQRLGSRVGPGPLGAASPTLASLLAQAESGGAKVTGNTEPFLLTGTGTWALALGLSTAKAAALGAVGWLALGLNWGVLAAIVSFLAFALYTVLLLQPGPFDRPRRVKIMGLGEAGSYLLLVFALVPALWPWLWVPFVVLPVLWFTVLNRVLWVGSGSAWAPGV